MEKDISIDTENLSELLNKYMPFLLMTVSSVLGRYVEVENDEEFSIAVSAFSEAVNRYEAGRGAFIPFAKTVIESRLKNHIREKDKEPAEISLDEMQENGFDIASPVGEYEADLHDEINEYIKELGMFGLSLEKLADEAPRHNDTRKTALAAAEKASSDEITVYETYKKKKLPIRRVARLTSLTEKVINRSKSFILAAMIIFIKKFTCLMSWIKQAG